MQPDHAVRPTTLSFHLSVNLYVFNLKSYTECHQDKKESRKQLRRNQFDWLPSPRAFSVVQKPWTGHTFQCKSPRVPGGGGDGNQSN